MQLEAAKAAGRGRAAHAAAASERSRRMLELQNPNGLQDPRGFEARHKHPLLMQTSQELAAQDTLKGNVSSGNNIKREALQRVESPLQNVQLRAAHREVRHVNAATNVWASGDGMDTLTTGLKAPAITLPSTQRSKSPHVLGSKSARAPASHARAAPSLGSLESRALHAVPSATRFFVASTLRGELGIA